jgi:hypothetical protein
MPLASLPQRHLAPLIFNSGSSTTSQSRAGSRNVIAYYLTFMRNIKKTLSVKIFWLAFRSREKCIKFKVQGAG